MLDHVFTAAGTRVLIARSKQEEGEGIVERYVAFNSKLGGDLNARYNHGITTVFCIDQLSSAI